MEKTILSASQEAIIKAWEQTHKPSRSRSKLRDHDTLILQKIAQGYTQQAVAELLNALGCQTSHQNLSRYLKKGVKSNSSNAKKSSNVSENQNKNGISQVQQRLKDQ